MLNTNPESTAFKGILLLFFSSIQWSEQQFLFYFISIYLIRFLIPLRNYLQVSLLDFFCSSAFGSMETKVKLVAERKSQVALRQNLRKSTFFILQNQRITNWLWEQGISRSHLVQPICSSRATQSRFARTISRQLLDISKDENTTSVCGQPVVVLSQPQSENVFPDVQKKPPVFQVVPTASGPVTECL